MASTTTTIRNPNRRKTPSFSSSLLDSIYRSIDNNGQDDHLEGRKQRHEATCVEEEILNLRRAIMIEKRTDWKLRGCAAASSSSDSSSAGTLSSSENDAFYSNNRYRGRARSVSSCFTPRRPKPCPSGSDSDKPTGFMITKLRALKIYDELIAKNIGGSPISPRRRISNFLNSLFTAKREKEKHQRRSNDYNHNCNYSCNYSKNNYNYDYNYNYKSTSLISSLSSSTRKSPSLTIHDQRSTATSPVVGENKKNIKDSRSMKAKIREDKTYPKANNAFQFREMDDDDDAESSASSDLFELAEHIIGIGKYSQELPVYETTSLKKNQAIANGFIK